MRRSLPTPLQMPRTLPLHSSADPAADPRSRAELRSTPWPSSNAWWQQHGRRPAAAGPAARRLPARRANCCAYCREPAAGGRGSR
ncbi:MAG: hypothetical protein MZW92_04320 [Comamonadaceae bacterium]|nr:hypothetical protein [Comamonadaceae bacterium]